MRNLQHSVDQCKTTLSPTPIISLINDQPRTLSTDVAAYFGKQHKNVMRQVQKTIDHCPKEWGRLNFEPSSYINEQGKEQPCYSMTKDGFTVLAMGFTGSKALEFKISYIEAFTWMENKLAEQMRGTFRLTGDGRPDNAVSTVKERKRLNDLVKVWQKLSAGLSFSDVWHQVFAEFDVENASQLKVGQIRPACKWVQAKIDELPKPLPVFDPLIMAKLEKHGAAHPQDRDYEYALRKYEKIDDKMLALEEELFEITGEVKDSVSQEYLEALYFLIKFEDMARAFPDVLLWFHKMNLEFSKLRLELAKCNK